MGPSKIDRNTFISIIYFVTLIVSPVKCVGNKDHAYRMYILKEKQLK